MPRNPERDRIESARRRNQLLHAGFELFSSNGIESVSLQTVSEKAQVGPATLYNYFQNKVNLVIAISATMWTEVYEKAFSDLGQEKISSQTAYEALDAYCDAIIMLYQTRPDILRFSGNYKTYINREKPSLDQLRSQLDALAPLRENFHLKYESARIDGSIRTDVTEQEIFSTICLSMLGMAERYAQGLVWAASSPAHDYSVELVNLKNALLAWVKGN